MEEINIVMKKTRLTPENSCLGKVRYDDLNSVNVHVKRFNKLEKNKRVKAYYCENCGGYHYGHETHRRMANIKKPSFIPNYDESEIKRNKNNTGSTGEFLNIKNNNL